MYDTEALNTKLADCKTKVQLYDAIVNVPFDDKLQMTKFGLGAVVLLMHNVKEKMIDRVALSNTEHAQGAVNISAKKFTDIKIPVSASENIIVKTIINQEPYITSDWTYLFTPDLTPQEARFNQAGAGIDCSVVYPLNDVEPKGALIFSFFIPPAKISPKHHEFMRDYICHVSSALRNID